MRILEGGKWGEEKEDWEEEETLEGKDRREDKDLII
jgi:hypothetical protein